jgi:hypothetical protein
MKLYRRSISRKWAGFVAALALVAAAPAMSAAEYVPPKMDEATCDQGATTGKDFTNVTSSDWYFIGAKPPCTSAASLKKYCARIQTRDGYVFEATAEAVNGDPELVGQFTAPFEDDEKALAAALYSHPKQSLQKSLQKCGLKDEQVRAKLVAEAEAASKTDANAALARDFAVIGMWAPDLAMTIWKRECQGHPFSDPNAHSESPPLDKYWKANPHYLQFCEATTDDGLARRPKDFTKIWKDIGALSSE